MYVYYVYIVSLVRARFVSKASHTLNVTLIICLLSSASYVCA